MSRWGVITSPPNPKVFGSVAAPPGHCRWGPGSRLKVQTVAWCVSGSLMVILPSPSAPSLSLSQGHQLVPLEFCKVVSHLKGMNWTDLQSLMSTTWWSLSQGTVWQRHSVLTVIEHGGLYSTRECFILHFNVLHGLQSLHLVWFSQPSQVFSGTITATKN